MPLIEIEPLAKPRQVRSDKWKQRPVVLKWRAWADQFRAEIGKAKFIPSDQLIMVFYISMPKSWSNKKKEKMRGKPHQVKKSKDLDNLEKALLDALFSNLPDRDDGEVFWKQSAKYWADIGKININNRWDKSGKQN